MGSTQNKNTRKHNPLGIIALIMGCIYSIPLVVYIITRSQLSQTLSIFLAPIVVISFITAKNNFWKETAENYREHSAERCSDGKNDNEEEGEANYDQ